MTKKICISRIFAGKVPSSGVSRRWTALRVPLELEDSDPRGQHFRHCT